ncbi:MAG: hypothetical protein LBS91_01925 [Clostridiales Family XIII bacterium]|jgi:hypothetical protein|nr:hypothetical protein [Clostridiales Family XIII bacterium]
MREELNKPGNKKDAWRHAATLSPKLRLTVWINAIKINVTYRVSALSGLVEKPGSTKWRGDSPLFCMNEVL